MKQPDGLTGFVDGEYAAGDLMLTEKDLEDDKQAVAFANQWYTTARRRKSALEKNWYECIEMFMGRQYLNYDAENRRWEEKPHLSHRVRYVANILLPYVLTTQAKLLRQKPKLEVTPATNDPEDAEIARTTKQIINYLWNSQHYNATVIPRFVNWLLICGTAGVKVYFDLNRGPEIDVVEDEESLLDAMGGASKEELTTKRVRLGEVQMEEVSPFTLYPDPNATSWDEMPVMMEARRRPLDWIRDNYGEAGWKVSPQDSAGFMDFYETRLARNWGGVDSGSTGGSASASAMVMDVWVRSCPSYPKGYHLVVSGNTVLQRGELPVWCAGEIPIYVTTDVEVPNKLWGSSIFDNLKGINKIRNRCMSQIIEHGNIVGNPPMLLPYGCRIDEKSITNRPGERIQYQPVAGHKPEYLSAPSLSPEVRALPQMTESDAMMVSGLNEPTFRASAPTNVRTSSGLAQLIREDDSRLSIRGEMISRALTMAGVTALRVVAEEYDVPRIGKIASDKNKYQIFEFVGENMHGANSDTPGANYFDLRVTIDTGHRSRQAQQEFLLNLVSTGAIKVDDEVQRNKFFKLLDLGFEDDAVTQFQGAEQVQREIRMLATLDDETLREATNEGMIGPFEFQDPASLKEQYESYMRSPEFLKHPREIKLRFMQQRNKIEHAILNKQMEEAQKAALMGGAMGGMQPQGGQQAPQQGGPVSMAGSPQPNKPMMQPGLQANPAAPVG